MVSSMVTVIAGMVIFFFLTPYVRGQLGTNIYGLWCLLGSLAGYLTLVQPGIDGAITKYVAEYRAKNDHEQLQRIVNSGLVQYLLIGAVAAVAGGILILLSEKISAMHDSERFAEARIALMLMIVNLLVNLPFVGIRATIAGLQRYDFINANKLLSTILGSQRLTLSDYSLLL